MIPNFIGIIFGFLQKIPFPHDTGPIYKETVAGRFPVEPFNTISNLIFLFIIIYFGSKVYRELRKHLFLAFVLPVLAIGYVGGTVYHATRSAEIWLVLDWVPILFLSLSTVFYFIYKWQSTWIKRVGYLIIIFGAFFTLRRLHIPYGLTLSVEYALFAIAILLPLIGYLYHSKWHNLRYVAIAFGIFACAVIFRILDRRMDFEVFWMGTHWLWHLFGGLAVFFLMKYIYEDNKEQAGIIS
ncbi:MAG: hypothetical protein V7767_07990 [Leeuwenhoekiella sp.]